MGRPTTKLATLLKVRLIPNFHWLILLMAGLWSNSALASAWWHCDWHYRTELTVSSTESVSNQVVHIDLGSNELHANYVSTPDGADLRILDSDNLTELDFHIEDWDAISGTALFGVKIPTLTANTAKTIYVYYGNTLVNGVSAVPTADNPTSTYTTSGWQYHTKYSTLDPGNEAEARAEFESAPYTAGYGCSIVSEVFGLTNRNTYNGPRGNYALYAETLFEVTTPGIWNFRVGIDYGLGGDFYINHTPMMERWNEDLWWARNYNHSDMLTGSVYLDVGYHHFETLGYEGCCDGPISVQFQAPGSPTWLEMNNANINLVTAGCPVGVQSHNFVQSDSPNRFGGLAFLDNGNNGTAHNAIREGAETGLNGVEITIDVVNTSSSTSVTTDAQGHWQTCLFEEAVGSDVEITAITPANHYAVSEDTAGINSDTPINGTLRFPVSDGQNSLNIQTGFIEHPTLTSDNNIELGAGATGILPHRYTPSSTGEISFQIAQLQHQQPGVYQYGAYRDQDCDGKMDVPAVSLSNTIAVQYGQEVCLIIEVIGTPSTINSSQLELRVDVTTEFDGIAISHTNSNTDTVNGSDPVNLVLHKSVCNATQSACDVTTGAGFVETNVGKPNDELVYRLEFTATMGALHNVSVYDKVPAYTKLKPSSISVVSEPAGMNCSVTNPADPSVPNFTETVTWVCNGQIEAAESGVVAFSVFID
ncbi:MAG: CCXG family PEP-CTERM protein [Gammaproteobacteria bacterium]|nr:CCXG family PEP-CTERM protein [Gammaproteobacteria bacterium]